MTDHFSSVSFEQTNGGTQYTVSPIATVANSDGVLGTATTDQGSLVTRELKSTDRVTIAGGMEVTVDQAVQYGHLTKNADGTYSDISQESAEGAQDTSESTDDRQNPSDSPEDSEGGLEVSDATNETLADWSASISEFTGSNAAVVAVLGDVMANGPDHMPSVLTGMAERYGVDASQIQNTIRETYSDINDAFCDYASAAGVEPNGFFEYISTNADPALWRSAVNSAVFAKDMAPFSQLLSQYKSTGQGQAMTDEGQTVKVQMHGRSVNMDKATARRRGFTI